LETLLQLSCITRARWVAEKERRLRKRGRLRAAWQTGRKAHIAG